MQDAKDSFYFAVRNRLAALNPERTVVLRGATRTAIAVAENELALGDLEDAFVMTWKESAVDLTEPMPLHTLQCEVRYSTRGTREFFGLDRGRVLDAMDGELRSVLQPAVAAKSGFGTSPATPLQTMVFWSLPVFGAAVLKEETLVRAVTLSVFALQEAGEA